MAVENIMVSVLCVGVDTGCNRSIDMLYFKRGGWWIAGEQCRDLCFPAIEVLDDNRKRGTRTQGTTNLYIPAHSCRALNNSASPARPDARTMRHKHD